MESLLLPISPSKTQKLSDSTPQLIREWLFRFGVEHREDVAPRLPLWLETFGAIDAATLEKLFVRAFRTCKFFPKVSEILEPLQRTKEAATPEAAEIAWSRVLEVRRTRWSPDAPGGFYGGAPQFSERIQSACRAAGVFREFTSEEFENGALHTWAKKKFIESFLAWEALEKDQYLLPDGEIKNLLIDAAQAKALPAPSVDFKALHERGLRYAAQIAAPATAPRKLVARPVREKSEVELAEELRRQKAALVARGWLPSEQSGQNPSLLSPVGKGCESNAVLDQAAKS
jgi:hypothetical protein